MTQIKNTDIIQDDIFENAKTSATDLNTSVVALEKTLRKILSASSKLAELNPLESYADIRDAERNIINFEQAQRQLLRVEQQRAQLANQTAQASRTEQENTRNENRLIVEQNRAEQAIIRTEQARLRLARQQEQQTNQNTEATEDQIRARIELQQATRRQRQEIQDLLVVENEEAGTLERARANIRLLTRERNRLNLDTEEGAERLVQINELIDQNNELIESNVDSLTQQRIGIGRYSEGVSEAISQSEELSGIMGTLTQVYNFLTSQIEDTTEATDDAGDTADSTGNSFTRLGNILKASFIGILIAGIGVVVKSLTASREATIEFQIKLEQFSNTVKLVGSALIDFFTNAYTRAKVFGNQIFKFFQELKLSALEIQDFLGLDRTQEIQATRNAITQTTQAIADQKKVVEETAGAFDNFSDKFSAVNAETDSFLRNQVEVSDLILQLSNDIAKLVGEEERLQSIADDSTKSFREQEEAQKEALTVAQERLLLEKQIAEQQLNVAVSQIQADFLSQNIQIEESQIRNLAFLKDRNLALKASQTAIDELAGAVVNLTEIENESLLASINAQKTLTEIRRDVFERELDFAIDAFDNQKTINESKIADDKRTFVERQVLLERTDALAKKSFDNQIGLLEDYTGKKLELEELIKIDDEEEIRRRLKISEFDDIVAGRILEVIKERKTALQDLADARTDLAEKVKEQAEKELNAEQALLEFRQEVRVQLAKENAEDNEESLQAKKELLDEEIKLEELKRDNLLTNAELLEDERQKIIEQSEENIRQLKRESLEEQADAEKKAVIQNQKDTQELVEAGSKALSKLIEEQTKKRLANIDAQIEVSLANQERLEEQAEKGVESTTENIAFEQKKQAELQAQREKEILRQKALELALLSLEIYSSKVGSGDKNALGSTISDVTKLTAFVSSIPAFYEGTHGKTVKDVLGNPDMAGKDGYIIRADGNEMILNPQETNEYQKVMNQGVIREPSSTVVVDNSGVQNALYEVKSAIESKPAYMGRDYNATERAITDTIARKNKIERNHKKTGGII